MEPFGTWFMPSRGLPLLTHPLTIHYDTLRVRMDCLSDGGAPAVLEVKAGLL